ncbi:hypothetical protein, partial [Mesorhizobium sp.]|uniref:hypothetical protein n=1 Tax=Mesorhizobium sp. TaxID=1871066 RepID=UPI0025DDEA8B
ASLFAVAVHSLELGKILRIRFGNLERGHQWFSRSKPDEQVALQLVERVVEHTPHDRRSRTLSGLP